MGNTAIGSLRLRCGGEHCQQGLTVEVRRGTLPSGAGRRLAGIGEEEEAGELT